MLETSVRLLRLLALLQSRRDWSGAELADRLGVTTRTVRNDIERLRVLGYRVESRTGVAGGYRLAAGSAVPPLLLDDDEAVAVGLGLRAAAAGTVTGIEETSLRALVKLERTLPARLRHRLDALRHATVTAPGNAPTVDAGVLALLAAACRDHEVLRFDYAGRDGGSARRVEPHRLVFTGRRWYLLAWDTDRGDWRTFRADRITPRPPTGPRFTPREPPEDAGAHVVRGAGSLAWPHPARVRLHRPAAAVHLPAAAGLVTPIDERTCLLETGAESLRDLVGFLTSLDVDFDVLDPPGLRDLLRRLAARCAAAAGPVDGARRGRSDGAVVFDAMPFDPRDSFGPDVAAAYDDAPLGDEDAAVARLATLAGEGPVLELAVGTGRLALPLAATGVRVDGVELSAAMIERLREKDGGRDMTVVHGDMATAELPDRYRLVFVAFNSLMNLVTQDEQVRCVANAARHLTDDGLFVVEVVVPDAMYALRHDRDGVDQYVDATRIGPDGVSVEVGRFDRTTQRVDKCHVGLGAGGPTLEPLALRYVWPSELDLMARLAGLQRRERWGGWSGEPFTGRSLRHVSVYGR